MFVPIKQTYREAQHKRYKHIEQFFLLNICVNHTLEEKY